MTSMVAAGCGGSFPVNRLCLAMTISHVQFHTKKIALSESQASLPYMVKVIWRTGVRWQMLTHTTSYAHWLHQHYYHRKDFVNKDEKENNYTTNINNLRKEQSLKEAWPAWGNSSLSFIEAVHLSARYLHIANVLNVMVIGRPGRLPYLFCGCVN